MTSNQSTIKQTKTLVTKSSAPRRRRPEGPRPIRIKKYPCPTCGKLFDRPCSVIQHTRSHTGQKPYHCPGCTSRFATRSNCLRHATKCCPERKHHIIQSEDLVPQVSASNIRWRNHTDSCDEGDEDAQPSTRDGEAESSVSNESCVYVLAPTVATALPHDSSYDGRLLTNPLEYSPVSSNSPSTPSWSASTVSTPLPMHQPLFHNATGPCTHAQSCTGQLVSGSGYNDGQYTPMRSHAPGPHPGSFVLPYFKNHQYSEEQHPVQSKTSHSYTLYQPYGPSKPSACPAPTSAPNYASHIYATSILTSPPDACPIDASQPSICGPAHRYVVLPAASLDSCQVDSCTTYYPRNVRG